MRRMLWFKLYNMISAIDKSGAAKISRGRERWKEKAKEKSQSNPRRAILGSNSLSFCMNRNTTCQVRDWLTPGWVSCVMSHRRRRDSTATTLMPCWAAIPINVWKLRFVNLLLLPLFLFYLLSLWTSLLLFLTWFLAHSSVRLWLVYKQGLCTASCLLIRNFLILRGFMQSNNFWLLYMYFWLLMTSFCSFFASQFIKFQSSISLMFLQW